jgi:HK97 gp10 family phage protein
MIKLTFKMEGLKELDRLLGELPKATGKNVLKRTLTRAAEPIRSMAERLAPKATGRLKRGIVVSSTLSKRQRSQHQKKALVEVYVGAEPLAQSTLQEFGTHNQPPQPFLRPAWDANKEAALEIIKGGLAQEIDRAVKRLAKKAAKKAGG